MKMTLHKSQKLLILLQKEFSSINFNSSSNFSIDVLESKEKILKKIQEDGTEQVNNFEKELILREDYFKLKTMIFKKNLEIGTHEIISLLNFKRQVKVLLQQSIARNLKKSNLYFKDVEASYIEDKCKMAIENNNQNTQVSLNFFDSEDIKNRVSMISKEINRLEEELAEKNATVFLEIDFNPITKEVLNLD